MAVNITLRRATRADWDDVAELIHLSTNHWYQASGRPRIFSGEPAACRLFCEVYESLEPGCCVVAVNDATGKIVGSCFYHPRPTHVSLGIMNAHPNYFGHGVAAKLLRFIINLAREQGKPLRLVSSAMNLDSFSLYNRAGMIPYAVYQDMIMSVPAAGLDAKAPGMERVRAATPADVLAMRALERKVHGIDRTQDFRYFIANEAGIWHTSVIEDGRGGLSGFLVSVCHPASRMLGPGVMCSDEDAVALICCELDGRRGETLVWLVPSMRRGIIDAMYGIGARNCEIHFAQILGRPPKVNGIVMPTFMPETS